jgi:hypothetical protein
MPAISLLDQTREEWRDYFLYYKGLEHLEIKILLRVDE